MSQSLVTENDGLVNNGLIINEDTAGGGNKAPTAFDDDPWMGGLTTNEDTPFYTVALQLNDTDPEDDPLIVMAVNGAGVGQTVALASGALITLQADGTVYYDPNGAFDSLNGYQGHFDSFNYIVSDGENFSNARATVAVYGITEEPPVPTEGNDTLNGGDDDDTIHGLGGNDRIYGHEGNDTLSGGDGGDYIRGGEGGDVLSGGTEKDHLLGEDGNDTLQGGDGADKLYGGNDNDIVYGGDGSDRMFGDTGNDKLYGEAGNDNIIGGDGADYIRGGTGDDQLYGGAGNDHLTGDLGNDQLVGGYGVDKLYGSDGNDMLIGNAGADQLWGGSGKDQFVFHTGDSTATSGDTVEDFQGGVDIIHLFWTNFDGLQAGAPSGDILGYITVDRVTFIASEDGSFALTIRNSWGYSDFDVTDVVI